MFSSSLVAVFESRSLCGDKYSQTIDLDMRLVSIRIVIEAGLREQILGRSRLDANTDARKVP